MTDQTTPPAPPVTDPVAAVPPADPAPTEPAPSQPAPPAKGTLVSFTHPDEWGPVERLGVVVGADASGEFAYVAPLPAGVPVPVGDLH